MSVYIGIKTIHTFGYQKFPPYYYAAHIVSSSLSLITRLIPPEIELMVYKIVYLTHFATRTNTLPEQTIAKAIEVSEKYYPRIALPARAIKVLEAVYAMKKESQSKDLIEMADIVH